MRFDANGGRAKNYEPNSFDGPRETSEPLYAGLEGGVSGSYAWEKHAEDDDFAQAGNLWRLMSEPEKVLLVENLAASLAQVRRDDIVARAVAQLRSADPGYGARVEDAVKRQRR